MLDDETRTPTAAPPGAGSLQPPSAPPSATRRRESQIAAIAVALLLAAFLAPSFRPGVGFLYRDNGRLHAPTKRWIAEELSHGRIAEWNPYVGLGHPVVANGVDAPLHPFNVLLVALPPAAALKAWVILSFAVAAAGAFAWSRAMGGSPVAAAVGALAFSLSGPLVSATDNIGYLTSFATLPWILAAAHRHVQRGGPVGLALVGVASAFCVAAGDPQSWGIAVVILPAYGAVAVQGVPRSRAWLRGAAASVAAVIAAAPVIVPLMLWVPHSDRVAGVNESARYAWNLHPRRLPELALPGMFAHEPGDRRPAVFATYAGNITTRDPWFVSVYVGASALALAALGAIGCRRARWLTALAVVAGWASLGMYGGVARLVTGLPLVGSLRYWEKLTAWVALAVAMAAASGCDALLGGRVGRRLSRAVLAVAIVAASLAATAAALPGSVAAFVGGTPAAAQALAANVARGGAHAALALGAMAALFALVARKRVPVRAASIAAACVLGADLVVANTGAYVLVPNQPQDTPALARALSPGDRVISSERASPDRFPELGPVGSAWERGRRTLASRWNVPVHIGCDEGYMPLTEGRWNRIYLDAWIGRRVSPLGLLGFGHVVASFSPFLAKRADFEGPFRVVGSDPALPAFLVEIPHRPRAYVAGDVRRVDEGGALGFALAGGAPGVTVVEAPVRAARWPDPGEARIVEDRPGETVVEARADAPALLVLNDAYAPGWTASVDGAPAEIVRANYAVRGVWLQPGEHRVRFRYRTPGLVGGIALVAAGGLVLAAWAAWRARRGSRAFPA